MMIKKFWNIPTPEEDSILEKQGKSFKNALLKSLQPFVPTQVNSDGKPYLISKDFIVGAHVKDANGNVYIALAIRDVNSQQENAKPFTSDVYKEIKTVKNFI